MVYLLRFRKPLGDPGRPGAHASYYLGWTPDHLIEQRLAEHRAGRGARITAAAVARGIEIDLVRTWPKASRKDERRLKRRGHYVRLDPAPPAHVPTPPST